ncbi:uncharacterized protein MONBRDRAFT_38890 [Monosiga brevicollis MX1]|uniref:Peptidase C45 hydrolase domain-containing protein n=1 Tax=Monosiga brevicollis TaxID=81824 RepID=A9VAT7_MONBE|nr:uncharacterized protein MONBRDRAFT_38890 [Monosiga brevicollis MX1]EDQ85377.1 predicted protein [Monosiga brevicollis MX1]|eukprot:XP_001749788.1 hypothetical protein [Monosiga brevicollis MX1]
MRTGCSLLVAVLAVLLGSSTAYFKPDLQSAYNFTVLKTYNKSTLYRIEANSSYDNAPLLVDLHGSRYEMGYAYGAMMADEVMFVYNAFLDSLLSSFINSTMGLDVAKDIIGAICDWQAKRDLFTELPAVYQQELAGITAAGNDHGQPDLGKAIERVLVLANMPGDIPDFIYVLIREYFGDAVADAIGKPVPSHVAFRGRNLDWTKDSGMNRYKLVTVFHPEDGFAHATVGFAPMWGAITGMSSQGITVHEANLEENRITFDGFPWALRLRYIMENARNLTEAKALWEATNNTVGFNHMVGSASDSLIQGRPAALVMETMHNYTAFFHDNDPREINATIDIKNKTYVIGEAIPDAVWRTNHGYDPEIREHFEWSMSPSSSTVFRYFIIHDALKQYEAEGQEISLAQMVNITAVVGNKGDTRDEFYTCADTTAGSNVVSVAFAPNSLTMAAAWERSTGDNWRPASCSTYIELNMNIWF